MYYRLKAEQEQSLLRHPETGMGYQIVEATRTGSYTKERFLVLNSTIAIEMDFRQTEFVRKTIGEGIDVIAATANIFNLNIRNILNEREFRNQLNEQDGDEKGAIENPVENANGTEVFVRLSAFRDDKRVDKTNKCLLPGSYSTTTDDYLKCKAIKDDPVERYALPSDEKIKWAFYIQPKREDTLQRGKVQPANGKRGGGKEVYFGKGTSAGTLLNETEY